MQPSTLSSRLIHHAARSKLTLPLRRLLRRMRETYYNTEVLNRISEKTAPLKVEVANDEKKRVNIIIPEINFTNFYGGYIAKFNLARALFEAGRAVRMILVDQCDVDRTKWHDCVKRYDGLEDIFDQIEVEYHFHRERPLRVNPSDGVIATTWWTAYIARELMESLRADRFVYLIQEYEPFTFPMGSYYAMADESYRFPHYAIFSSALLQEYFANSALGVYRDGNGFAESMHFENAIVRYDDSELSIGPRSVRRLLFYARPEAHATRNMFEIGYQALVRAINSGIFSGGNWEFHGVGSEHGDIPLVGGKVLKMLGKFDLGEYRRRLLDYDLGLSLMYTPHPSLLPLEMAAAGIVVVSNECLNKTAGKLQSLSENIIAGRPTIDGVVDAIGAAILRVDDYQGRRRGAQVRWASSWSDALREDFMSRLQQWLV